VAGVAARLVEAADIDAAAALLDRFNREFDTPTPGPAVIARRLRSHLDADSLLAFAIGDPIVGIAVVSLRPNVWHDGPVALLDELYVVPERRDRGLGTALIAAVRAECRRRRVEQIEINVDIGDTDARRFYERHGFTAIEPDTGEHALWYHGPVD
jgi:GNAT superfamily N-acetyltransferase